MKANRNNSDAIATAVSGRIARLRPIGVIRSDLKERSKAPKQASEGAPDAWLEVSASAWQGLDGIAVGQEIIVLTWLHQAHRDVLKVHPRSDPNRRLTGVFATRSPDRPNPIGLHTVTAKSSGNDCGLDPWKRSTAHR